MELHCCFFCFVLFCFFVFFLFNAKVSDALDSGADAGRITKTSDQREDEDHFVAYPNAVQAIFTLFTENVDGDT